MTPTSDRAAARVATSARTAPALIVSARCWIACGCALVYLGSVLMANWLTSHVGFVPVGFGQTATAGTFAIGGALIVRDLVQDTLGRAGVLGLLASGGLLSFAVSTPGVAVASMAAFLLSETLDMIVYTPLRRRGRFGGGWWRAGVAAGALLGSLADSVVFLGVAFGTAAILPSLGGQLLGKGEVAASLIILGSAAHAVLREPLDRPGA